jgi:transcriptional regulator with XRE-family HTH domain
MRIDADKLKKILRKKSLSLNALLKKAGVSKTAFYHLLYKDSVLPASLGAIASSLAVRPSAFLTDRSEDVAQTVRLLNFVDRIVSQEPGLDRDNIRLTLLLLEETPLDRLCRSLTRGRAVDFRR